MVVQLSVYSTFVLWLQFGYGRSVTGHFLAEMNKLHSDSVCSRDVLHSVCSRDVVQKTHLWLIIMFWFLSIFDNKPFLILLGFFVLCERWLGSSAGFHFFYIQHCHVKAYYHLLADCVCCDVTIWEFFLHTCMHAHTHAHACMHKHTHTSYKLLHNFISLI